MSLITADKKDRPKAEGGISQFAPPADHPRRYILNVRFVHFALSVVLSDSK